jgi:hypothetical protein
MNNHNGKYNAAHRYNPYVSHNDSSVIGYKIVTTKKIKKSEELYHSYNRCNICEAWADHHGTPEIFISFGFVEVMPQRWLFDFARVKFDLDWKDADESTGDVPPSAGGIALLQEELARPKDAGIPESEWQSLWQYYHALKTALESAVEQSRDGNMTDEVRSSTRTGGLKMEQLQQNMMKNIRSKLGVSHNKCVAHYSMKWRRLNPVGKLQLDVLRSIPRRALSKRICVSAPLNLFAKPCGNFDLVDNVKLCVTL